LFIFSQVEISKLHAGIDDSEFHEDILNRQISMFASVSSAGACTFSLSVGACEVVTDAIDCPLQQRVAVGFSYNFTTKLSSIHARNADGTEVAASGPCNRVKSGNLDGLVVGASEIVSAVDDSATAGNGDCGGTFSYSIEARLCFLCIALLSVMACLDWASASHELVSI